MIVDRTCSQTESNIWKQVDSQCVLPSLEEHANSMLLLPKEVQKKILEAAYVLGQKASSSSTYTYCDSGDDDNHVVNGDDEIRDDNWHYRNNSSHNDMFCTYQEYDDGFSFDNNDLIMTSSFSNNCDDITQEDEMDEPLLGLQLLNNHSSSSSTMTNNRNGNSKRFKFPWRMISFLSLRRKMEKTNYFIMSKTDLADNNHESSSPGIMQQESIPSLVDISILSEPSVNNDNEIEVILQPPEDEDLSLTFSEEEEEDHDMHLQHEPIDYPDDKTLEFTESKIEVTLMDDGEEISYEQKSRAMYI